MPSPTAKHVQPGWKTVLLALGIDTVLVVLFAALGRSSHSREATLFGLWDTAWPFLAGLTIMWVSARISKHPLSPVKSGIPLWIGTVALGMILRALTGSGTALPFVIVATVSIAVFLIGWRMIAQLLGKLVVRQG
ncbi:DUF3054 domain-containing protein [Leucobacter coleopterorum]|uniref:DUF3054 domain-containing protein n=2 Tax=Leucobacter coleopterorum TaxID=2714933 RepID=A0ABX6K3Z3_9MICO|nr:DUF3054 domain-containing protein [Leucobacter coleopterorum]